MRKPTLRCQRGCADAHTDVFSITLTLCYGRKQPGRRVASVWSSGGMSQLAFSRGLSSGGNLDKRSYADFGKREVQDAVLHALDVCSFGVVILQPNCRTTGLPSYFNSE
eukprot:4221144-Pyramimonas_sp.AAC.1